MGTPLVDAFAVAVAAAATPVAVDEAPAKVCLNKINLSTAARISPPLPPPRLPHAASEIRASPTRLHRSSPPPPPLACSHRSCRSRLQPGSSSSGVGSTTSSPPGIRLRASSSTSGDGKKFILRSPDMRFLTGSVDPPSTVASRGLSIRVYAPSTPLPSLAGELVVVNVSDVAVVLIRSQDLVVIRSSSEDICVTWLLNI